jgi:hypothetical protein
MDLSVLKKKLSVYRDQGGSLKKISDELLHELLVCWESWDGTPANFYSALGTNGNQMASVIGRAKRYKREGRFGSAEFREAVLEGQVTEPSAGKDTGGKLIEFVWPDGRLVRFSSLDSLLEFIRRTA